MNLSEWRKQREEGEEFTLPTGLVVRLRKCDLLDLAEQGAIPTPLMGLVSKMLGETIEIKAENAGETMDAINLVVKACLVDPPVADEPDDGHITVDELTTKDRLAIYNWANMGASTLAPFRREDGKPAGAEGRLADIRQKAKPDPGD